MAGSRVTNRGAVTLPKAIRDHLRLEAGHRVKFFVHPNGSVALLPTRPVSDLRGILKSGRRATIEEMNEAILDGVAKADRRTKER